MTDTAVTQNCKETVVNSRTGRVFLVKYLDFQNGCVLSISEDLHRLGSLYVSTALANSVRTAKVIPSITDSLFLNAVSERVASMINGLAIVNFSSKNQLNNSDMEDITAEILKFIKR
jgi:hypothetical protein